MMITAVQRAQQQPGRDKQPGVSRALGEEARKRMHRALCANAR